MSESLDRRTVLALGPLAALMSSLPTTARSQSEPSAAAAPTAAPAAPPGAPRVAMLVHPRMVALDLIGPLTVFNILGFDAQLVWKTLSPVSTDVGLAIAPTMTFAQCPAELDVLFVPGGLGGSVACMGDPVVLEFLADRGSRARWVTSVCTGGLVLAAAGLLKGYDATTHWAVTDLLPLMGARHVDQRVVRDRNRVTGGGVTAGIDFGLTLAAAMRGEEAARRVQLIIEYAPDPPFANGTPQEAGPERVAQLRTARRNMDRSARDAAEAAGRRLGV